MGVKVGALLGLLAVLAGGSADAAQRPAPLIVFAASPDNATDGQHLFGVAAVADRVGPSYLATALIGVCRLS